MYLVIVVENLQAALQESERLLGELTVMVRSKTPEISQFAKTLSNATETLMHEVSALER
jgi:hypothetical protein